MDHVATLYDQVREREEKLQGRQSTETYSPIKIMINAIDFTIIMVS